MRFAWLAAARDWFVALPWPTWGEFAELLKALSSLLWPVVILVLIVAFKNDLRRLISNRRLKRGKLFGQEFELEEQLDRLQREAEQLPPPPPPQAEPPTPAVPGETPPPRPDPLGVTRQILTEAGTSPKAALMLLSSEIEGEMRQVVESIGVAPRSNSRPLDMVRLLEQIPAVPREVRQLMFSFRDVRNRIVHGYQADPDDVLRAIDVGMQILSIVRSWRH